MFSVEGPLNVPNQIPSVVVLDQKTLSWVFFYSFSTGSYAGIGTKCVESENIMKSTKKDLLVWILNGSVFEWLVSTYSIAQPCVYIYIG